MLLNKCFDFSQYTQFNVAIISDTHGEVVPEVQELIKECDIVVHAGDIGNYQTLKRLKPKLEHVLAVTGNNDVPYIWDVKDWDIVNKMPKMFDIQLSGGTLSVEHGHLHDMIKPSHESLRYAHQHSRAVIYGHTHHQVIDDINSEQWVVNPGAAGETRTHGGASCLKLLIDNENWEMKAYRF